ncbi:MAG: periplasmic heavy metal sensor [Desulfobacteraceae bacterium]|nr:periplasmic heavy metal sensor [Desulfobacteraceae bacterium]
MKRTMAVSALIIVISMWSVAYASEGTGRGGSRGRCSPQELLAQLPADKEMLFHQTMREAREKASAIRAQIKALREEIKGILTADRFEEDLFREKTNSLEMLHGKMRATMEEAVVKLAKQFTADERKILAELLPPKPGRHRHLRERRHQ